MSHYGPNHAPPVDPATHLCEFCDETASEVYPITDGLLYIYTCLAHFEKGVDSVTGRRPAKPRRSRDQAERLFDVDALPRVE